MLDVRKQHFEAVISTRWLEGLCRPSLPLPGSSGRTEDLVAANHLSGVGGTAGTIQSGTDNSSTPVVRHALAWELDTEEDDDGAQRKTNVPGGRGDVVVLHPPTTVSVTDELVKGPAHHDVTQDVHSRVGRNITEAGKDQRHADLANQRYSREDTSEAVNHNWSHEAGNPEVLEALVDSTRRKDVLGSNGAPNYGCVVEGLDGSAGELP